MTDDDKKDLEVRLNLIKEKYALWQKYREAEEYWRARCMALEEFIEQMPQSWTDLTPGQQKAVEDYRKFLNQNKEPQ
ncbi:MAG: hypothetical protein IPJ00_17535 [Saprospirales bacterium]|nr:hypothetical protein [Saprospirales bacterium]